MEMLDINRDKAESIALEFSRFFNFLETDLGMSVTEEKSLREGAGKYVRIFKNNLVQIELAGDQHYFFTIIRRLVKGKPQPYSDRLSNITSEDLAVLLTNHNYNHLDYYVPSAGWENVLGNTAKLLNEGKEFLTEKWADTEKIENLKERDFKKKFGSFPIQNEDFFSILKDKAIKLLKNKGYEITFDNSELPPYDSNSLSKRLEFEKSSRHIKISQRDWRDFPTIYFLEIDGNRELELNTADSEINIAVNLMLSKIEALS